MVKVRLGSGAHCHQWCDAEFFDLKITTVSPPVFKDGASIQMRVLQNLKFFGKRLSETFSSPPRSLFLKIRRWFQPVKILQDYGVCLLPVFWITANWWLLQFKGGVSPCPRGQCIPRGWILNLKPRIHLPLCGATPMPHSRRPQLSYTLTTHQREKQQ